MPYPWPRLISFIAQLTTCVWIITFSLKAQREEDKKFADIKRKLRKDISELRNTVLQMIDVNSQLPDIEKLERHEFNMDVEERLKLIAEGEEKIKEVCQLITNTTTIHFID